MAGHCAWAIMVPNGALIYSRLGWVESEFDTSNKVNNQPTGYDDSDWETGIQYLSLIHI